MANRAAHQSRPRHETEFAGCFRSHPSGDLRSAMSLRSIPPHGVRSEILNFGTRRKLAKVMVADASKRSDIVNDHSLPKRFAPRYESRVVLTLLLVELVIREGLEVE